MSEKSREDEKLSFKEQILRDLERVKKHEEDYAAGQGYSMIWFNPFYLEAQ